MIRAFRDRPVKANPNDARVFVSPACRVGDHSNCTGAASWRCNCPTRCHHNKEDHR